MPSSRNSILSRIPIQTVLLILFICLLSCTVQLPSAVRATHPSDSAFAVPVKIETFGKAWDGYLAFGLWNFPYGASNFSLTPDNYLVVMTTKGQILNLRTTMGENLGPSMPGFAGVTNPTYAPIKYLGNDTLMFEGEPTTSTHFWNLKTNATTDFPNVYGHHDMIYNPTTSTFLTLSSYVRSIDGRNVLMDTIVELDSHGNVLWTWDTYERAFRPERRMPLQRYDSG